MGGKIKYSENTGTATFSLAQAQKAGTSDRGPFDEIAQHIQAAGGYKFTAEIEQTLVPRPVPANIGQGAERVDSALAGDVVHINMRVFKPASVLLVFGQLGVALVWGVLIITAVLFFPVWLVRRLRKKIAPGAAIRIRTWPLLAGVSALSFVGLFMIGMNDPFKHLGTPNVVSIGIMLATILLAAFAALGVMTSFKERHTPMNRFMYWHSSLASVFHLAVTAYLLSYSVIGLMTWA